MNPIQAQLNGHKWHTKDLDDVTLMVTHRGALGDVAYIHGNEIATIGADGIHLVDREDGAEGAFIPYHRVRAIRAPT